MPNIEWSVAHELRTPYASILLNETAGYRYMIQADSYEIVPSMRVTQDAISQANGSVLHPRWKTGLVATVKVAYDITEDAHTSGPVAESETSPACGADLRYMHEQLTGALNSILRQTGGQQRLIWTPTGYGDRRMLDEIQVLGWPTPEFDLDGTEALVTFSVESPFPYAIDETQTTTAIAGSGSVTNAGNCEFSPVVKVYGPTSAFTVTNTSDLDDDGNPRAVVYDGTRPGAVSIGPAQYAEIDFFRGTIILNGNISDLVAGIDPIQTDFWHLLPNTANAITITGATCDVLSNNAWC